MPEALDFMRGSNILKQSGFTDSGLFKYVDDPETLKRNVMIQIESYKDERIHKGAQSIVNRMNK